jgi:DNA repair ATPase RecN
MGLKMNLQTLQKKFDQKKGQRYQICKDISQEEVKIQKTKKEIRLLEKAQEIITAVAKLTQQELEFAICEPVTLAMAAVYDDPYTMVAEFTSSERGATECALKFERNGFFVKPSEASGGGPIDIASFMLRVDSWSLTRKRTRPVLILDEPFKWVSREKMPLAGEMLQETSRQLGLQIIMVSHIPDLIDCADKIFETSIKNGVTTVIKEEVQNGKSYCDYSSSNVFNSITWKGIIAS